MPGSYRAFRGKWMLAAIALFGWALLMVGAAPPAASPTTQPRSEDIARQRYETAEMGYRDVLARTRVSAASVSDATEWLRRRMHARLDLQQPKAERIAGLEK